MTLPDQLVREWIDSLVERTGVHLRAELGALASRLQMEGRPAVDAARPHERQRDRALVSVVLDAVTALDQATSLSAALDVLVETASAHAGHVRLAVRRGSVLAGWRSTWCAPDGSAATPIEIPLDDEGLVARAARSARTETGSGAGAGAATDTPHDPAAMAVPLLVGGGVVAVLYAGVDRGNREHVVPGGWPEVVEVLARHAARCLEAMTLSRLPELLREMPPAQPSGEVLPQAT